MATGHATVTVKVDDEKIKERMKEFLAQAWDEGYNQATFEFVDSDYCGTTHKCEGIIGTRNDEKNPYRQ